MIRILLFVALYTTGTSVFSQEEIEQDENHHCLYEEKSLTVGLGGIYSLDLEGLGINGRMYYNIGESLCFGPECAYFKTDEYEVVDLDFVGHYIFETPLVGIYPLLGANYTVETELEENKTIDKLGLVFGAGIHRNFNSFAVFMEYSRVQFGIEDQFVTGGLMYNFK